MAIIDHFITHLQNQLPELTSEQIAYVVQGVQIKQLSAKEHWFCAGDMLEQMAFVVTGLCKLYYTTDDGENININFMTDGDVAGDYQAFLHGIPCKYSLQALEDCTLILMSKAHLHECTLRYPVFYRYLNQRMTQLLFCYIERTEQFLITDAQSRYTNFVRNQPHIFKRLAVSELCSYLGITRQSLTRIRKQLHQFGEK